MGWGGVSYDCKGKGGGGYICHAWTGATAGRGVCNAMIFVTAFRPLG